MKRAYCPGWWQRCRRSGHDVSVLEKSNTSVEYFCADCLAGAGKGEIVALPVNRKPQKGTGDDHR